MMFHTLHRISSITTILLSITIAKSLATRHYEIPNNCPQTIQIYINGESQGYIDAQTAISHNYQDDFSGFIYSDANGGVVLDDGTSINTTRAAFKGTDNYYYILSDKLNTGISIVPVSVNLAGKDDGFCVPIFCDMNSCPHSTDQPITHFPQDHDHPPQSPLFECPDKNTGYVVTFCPSGVFP
ncbi:hypothetical protein AGABI1DRAFT_128805 [Agaricus bisporus var. burnettii JB137-S8]|uniref:Osmotin, thaumatin-like protein n=1 Tax=Agaricus bisporus var. burnettii (strain JB137-S8 / ATCC MYA-4627 / FGSC 10392) TaxID=597362 RepID=K5X9I0_AGABU|nr:uncharacterized protein AGABI1DRAFT_128805 [Agaricus bisporus var. burnettii JB137-S8]EKM79662.1 hypothetical protein AGABI1DRAFT_128805 [Agaricus bisporus var. burnettii JB137-S8]